MSTAMGEVVAQAPMDRDVACPRCGYNLRALPQPRCPECALQFTWDEVIHAADKERYSFLFEHLWRDKPLRSFFTTFWRSLRPWSFWTRFNLTLPVRLTPLVTYLLVAYVSLGVVAHVCSGFSRYCYWNYRGTRWTRRGAGGGTLQAILSDELTEAVYAIFYNTPYFVLWIVCSVLSLRMFYQSLVRHHVRPQQLLRVVLTMIPPACALWVLLRRGPQLIIDCASLITASRGVQMLDVSYWVWWLNQPPVFVLLLGVCGLLWVVSLRYAIGRYLQIEHSWAVASASVMVTALATAVLWINVFLWTSYAVWPAAPLRDLLYEIVL